MKDWIKNLPWALVLMMCLTLGLAPFTPPHLWEKIVLLINGELARPIDIGDLIMHGAPWLILAAKLFMQKKD